MPTTVNYNDERFQAVEDGKKEALTEIEQAYGGIINEAGKYYDAQIDASKQWAEKQTELQNEQTDLAIEKIEQQKEQAKKDYLKEQTGAYTDFQKQTAQHGINAEQMASQGMSGTGYSESVKASQYNTYQQRITTARDVYSRAVINYDNGIKEAILQNSVALAEINFQSLQAQLELSLEGFKYNNQLILDKADKKLAIDSEYYGRYMDVLSQINTENALAEEIRQYDTSLAEERRQFELELERLRENDRRDREYERQKLAEEQRQFDAQLSEETRQFNVKNSGSQGGSSMFFSQEGDTSGGNVPYTLSPDSISESLASLSNNESSDVTIDWNSAKEIGLGAMSEEQLAEMVKIGLVNLTLQNGKLVFSKPVS